MSITAGIFTDDEGDRLYNTGTLAILKKAQVTTGVYPHYLNSCLVTKAGDMDLDIATGAGMIEGYDFNNEMSYAVTVGTGHSTYSRIDSIVAQLDLTQREITLTVIAGTAAGSPVAPTLTQTSSLYQLELAQITVLPNVIILDDCSLVDKRTYAYANAQNAIILSGTYTGNGAASRTIALTFTPSAVLVCSLLYGGFNLNQYLLGGLAVTGSNALAVAVTTNGFIVNFDNSTSRSNQADLVYNYIAFR